MASKCGPLPFGHQAFGPRYGAYRVMVAKPPLQQPQNHVAKGLAWLIQSKQTLDGDLRQPNSVFAVGRYFQLDRRARRQCGGDRGVGSGREIVMPIMARFNARAPGTDPAAK
jgi:hypothetical protein